MTETPSQPYRNKYGLYRVPPGVEHRPAVKAIMSGLPYEPLTIEFMRAHAGRGDIVHAGAFFGDFIPALSAALSPEAWLWTFEPNPANFAAAQETVSLNRVANATLANVALSDRDSTVLVRTVAADGRPLGGASRLVDEAGEGVETVRSVMLDHVVPPARTVSILHLDVEGHEKPALLGAVGIVNRCKPILILETFEDIAWLNRTFDQIDYRLVGEVHFNQVFAVAGSGVQV